MTVAAVHNELSSQAVRSVPMDDGGRVVCSATGGFRLECKTCAWYKYSVSEHGVRPRLGAEFSSADTAELAALEAAHRCPPDVKTAAEAARKARGSATASAG